MLSHRVWQARFGGAPSVVGRTVFLDGTDHLVIGVMPAGFAFPEDPDAWVSVERILGEAFRDMPLDQQRRVGVLQVLAKRLAAASTDDVRHELTNIVRGLQQRHAPASGEPTTAAAITPFANAIVGRLGPRLWIALAMSAAVLLVAWANVAAMLRSLLKERGVELNTRVFLGSTRGRLVCELAIETVPIVALGAVTAALVWLLLIDLLSPSTSISASGIGLRARWPGAVLLILSVAVINWVIVGVLPAMASSNRPADRAGGSARVVARASRIGAPLLLGQAAMTIAVVTLAGAAVQTFQRLSAIDIGFATKGVTLIDFSLPAWKYEGRNEHARKVEQLQAGLRELPSVKHVAAVSVRPFRFGEVVDGLPVRRSSDATLAVDEATHASRVAVTSAYFDALGQHVLQGRVFSALDGEKTQPVAIISQTLARALFGDRPAIGETIDLFSLSEKWRSRVIVGVAGDAQYRGLERPSLEVYVPVTQVQASIGSLVIASDAPLSEAGIRHAMRAVEPDVAIEGFQTTGELRASVLAPARLLATVVSLLAGAGLVLLALGIFAAAAAALRAARAEIAVRQAVGARPLQAATAPLRVLARALAVGVAAGVFGSPIVLLAAEGAGLSASGNVVASISVAAALVFAVAAAAAIPSMRRAASLSPAQLLRSAQ
jgi:putative ABC transport system permease protein